jgi:hypothetical protein
MTFNKIREIEKSIIGNKYVDVPKTDMNHIEKYLNYVE